MRNILSLLLITSIYFGLHLFIYFSLVRFFGISSFAARLTLLLTLILLSIGFVGTAALSRLSLNPLTTALYRLSAMWVGMFIFLVVTMTIAWMIHLVLSRYGINAAPLLGTAAFGLALLPILVAGYNALRPSVTEIEVPIKNLPTVWQDRTIIQLSDVHLGQIQTARYAETLVDQVNALNPYIILITGDLFDGMGSEVAKFIPTLNRLRAERGVYFVTGNHEHYLGIEKVLKALEKSNFRILNNELVKIDGLQIVGLAFPGLSGESYPANIITSLPEYQPEIPTVLMYHEPVSVNHEPGGESNRHSELYFSPIIDYSVQKGSGVNLQLSGHTHAGQFFPFNLIAQAIFHEFYYGLHTDGDFSIYVTSGAGTWGPPLRLGTKSEIVKIKLMPANAT